MRCRLLLSLSESYLVLLVTGLMAAVIGHKVERMRKHQMICYFLLLVKLVLQSMLAYSWLRSNAHVRQRKKTMMACLHMCSSFKLVT